METFSLQPELKLALACFNVMPVNRLIRSFYRRNSDLRSRCDATDYLDVKWGLKIVRWNYQQSCIYLYFRRNWLQRQKLNRSFNLNPFMWNCFCKNEWFTSTDILWYNCTEINLYFGSIPPSIYLCSYMFVLLQVFLSFSRGILAQRVLTPEN